ncbi:MAG: hypothetical protein WA476_01495 [Acidobacteriaceae bacterium]
MDIIDPRIVEIFFNLLWMAITVALGAAWISGRRNLRAQSVLPAIGLQFVALALLAVILLPAISLTDDLQSTTNPAETERLSRRGDLQPSPDQPVHPIPVALALFVVPRIFQPLRATGILPDAQPRQQTSGFSSAVETRPPPQA